MKKFFCCIVVFILLFCETRLPAQDSFTGKYFSGTGDTAYLHLLDQAYRMMQPDPEIENLSFLYRASWNGFVEGPTWNYWWIQNSFGPSYTMLPFMDKAYQTFLYNSQALWFNVMGNGVRKDNNNFVGPVGVLGDCARDSPTDFYCKQGDYQVNLHDWGFGFTTAGILLQSELMLIRRDPDEIKKYLPLLETCAAFVDSRRDTVRNIFLIGTAGNLLAPSYAGSGIMKKDSSYEMAYLAEISVNYIAALTRLVELEKMTGNKGKVALYNDRITKIRQGLLNFKTDEGYFIRSLDLDGTKHGLFGAARHGYFEVTPNQDAMAFRVVDDAGAKAMYKKIASIPGLRPNKLILPNYPSYDDMYDADHLFKFGGWVNGGHWTTCEARMLLGYYRVNAFRDAGDAFEVMLQRAYNFRLDNPLSDFGAKEYQPDIPVNCVYDSWGAPGGFMRGLFEYEYKADGLTLYPHIPDGITGLQQSFPVYFGKKKIYVNTSGNGEINAVTINDQPVKNFTPASIFLPMDDTEESIYISIGLGKSSPARASRVPEGIDHLIVPDDDQFWNIDALRQKEDTQRVTPAKINELRHIARFYKSILSQHLEAGYEAKHAQLILKGMLAIYERRNLKKAGRLTLLPANSQLAADALYIDTVVKESDGLIHYLETNGSPSSGERVKATEIWKQSK